MKTVLTKRDAVFFWDSESLQSLVSAMKTKQGLLSSEGISCRKRIVESRSENEDEAATRRVRLSMTRQKLARSGFSAGRLCWFAACTEAND
ncbi:hypothetical protein BaRGS_00025001 [Batillaria attramentaria]|uniref:Uncharacterized protein n=1 Tax=Batillaria attramentaria TaxID=370345 RepID=A0ABD0K9P5_9CAEN